MKARRISDALTSDREAIWGLVGKSEIMDQQVRFTPPAVAAAVAGPAVAAAVTGIMAKDSIFPWDGSIPTL